MPTQTFDAAAVRAAVDSLTRQILASFDKRAPLNVVGIVTRGVVLADRIIASLRHHEFTNVARGVLDVGLYRDDLARRGGAFRVRTTEMSLELNDRPLLLVDDVLFTGRSIRAALDHISDFGRPSVVKLATLVNRGGRESPISADFVGLRLDEVPASRRVNVRFHELDGRDEIELTDAPRRAETTPPTWKHRHLLGLESLTAAEILHLLDTAVSFKEVSTRSVKKVPALRGKVVVNAFFEDSTRTRTSFSLAAQRLSADVIDFSAAGSSVSKGETLVDTARTIEAMGIDAIVLRHAAAGSAELLARTVKCSVINAGDGAHEHPTQGLLDVYTIRDHLGSLAGVKVAIVGDIANSRVARSNLFALTKLGAKVFVVGPTTLVPKSFEQFGATVVHDFDAIIGEVDVINMLRVQNERMKSAAFPTVREFTSMFGLTWDRFQRCKPDVLVMHPGPMNRGVEIQSDIADGPRSVILEQVTNGLAVRMAVLYSVLQAGGAT